MNSVAIKSIILESVDGSRVKIPLPNPAVIPSGGILRNLTLGAIRTDELINSFAKSSLKLREARDGGDPEAVGEMSLGQPQREFTEVVDGPVVHCACTDPSPGRRCTKCGNLKAS